MQNFPLPLAKLLRVLPHVFFGLGLGLAQGAAAQAFENGDFENGSLGWSGCITEMGTAVTYGGAGSNRVAEVDGHFNAGPSDDRMLCQTITGFIVGGVYRLEFQATRRGNNTPPNPVSVTVTMNDALQVIVTRSGGYAMVAEGFEFTATSTTHQFMVRPNFQGSFGMIFDNFALYHLYTLPIELLYFTGEAFTDGVHLSWATATEQDNDHFTIQRSSDGQQWQNVLEVQGAGNSVVERDYSANDPSPMPGLSYYRLKQTDIHGDETVFTSVSVHSTIGTQVGLSVFPNPSTNGQLWLAAGRLAEEVTVPVTIIDMQGRLVHTAHITLAPGVAVEISREVPLDEGVYLVSIPVAGVPQGVRVVVQ